MYKKGVGRKWTRRFLGNEASTSVAQAFTDSRNDSSSGLGLRNYTYCYAILFSGFRVTSFFFPFSFFSFRVVRAASQDRGLHLEGVSFEVSTPRPGDGSGSVQSISSASYVRTSSKRLSPRKKCATSRFFEELLVASFNVYIM